MNFSLLFLIAGTFMFILSAARQFRILYKASNDGFLKAKLLFFIFTVFIVLSVTGAFCSVYFHDPNLLIPASIFYCIAGGISVWAYYSKENWKK